MLIGPRVTLRALHRDDLPLLWTYNNDLAVERCGELVEHARLLLKPFTPHELLHAVRAALQEVGHLEAILPADERAGVEAALAGADAAMHQPDADAAAIRSALGQLERASEPFARRRMERALNAGMEGKSLFEVEDTLAGEAALDERRGGHSPELVDDDPGAPARAEQDVQKDS